MRNYKLTVKKIIIVASCLLLLWLLVGALSGLKCYYDTKAWYRSATKNKLIRLYCGILIYEEKFWEYPPGLMALIKDEITEEQNINDVKDVGQFYRSEKYLKNPLFLYDNHLRLNTNDDVSQIIVAEPIVVDNMRYIIYTKYINEFAKRRDEIKKNPKLRTYYFEKSEDSVKRIPESEFQEQAKKQDWKINAHL